MLDRKTDTDQKEDRPEHPGSARVSEESWSGSSPHLGSHSKSQQFVRNQQQAQETDWRSSPFVKLASSIYSVIIRIANRFSSKKEKDGPW